MERLKAGPDGEYSALEAAIHVSRYAPVIPICSEKSILDIACGEGYGTWLLSQSGAISVDGVDVSPEAISEANRTFKANNLCFHLGLIEDLPAVTKKKYDLITCIETIEHVADAKEFLEYLKEMRAEGGMIYLTCPNDHWYFSEDRQNPFHVRKFRFEEFQKMATSVLGDDVHWMAGTAAQGFVTYPVGASEPAVPSSFVAVSPILSAMLCLSDRDDNVVPEQSAYFVGVWGDPNATIGGGAFFPMSMDRYGIKEGRLIEYRDEQNRLKDESAEQNTAPNFIKTLLDIAQAEDLPNIADVTRRNAENIYSLVKELELSLVAEKTVSQDHWESQIAQALQRAADAEERADQADKACTALAGQLTAMQADHAQFANNQAELARDALQRAAHAEERADDANKARTALVAQFAATQTDHAQFANNQAELARDALQRAVHAEERADDADKARTALVAQFAAMRVDHARLIEENNQLRDAVVSAQAILADTQERTRLAEAAARAARVQAAALLTESRVLSESLIRRNNENTQFLTEQEHLIAQLEAASAENRTQSDTLSRRNSENAQLVAGNAQLVAEKAELAVEKANSIAQSQAAQAANQAMHRHHRELVGQEFSALKAYLAPRPILMRASMSDKLWLAEQELLSKMGSEGLSA